MSALGSLAVGTQFDHVLLGPRHLKLGEKWVSVERAAGSEPERAWKIESNRTTFAWPFRRDSIDVDGQKPGKRRFSPIGIKKEDPLYVMRLASEKTDAVALFDGDEVYLTNKHGHILLADGTAIVPKYRANRSLQRKADGTLEGQRHRPGDRDYDGEPNGVIYAKPRLAQRLQRFIMHKKTILNPRLIVALAISGLFDTAIYYTGKWEGQRDMIHRIGKIKNSTSHNDRVARTVLSDLLPVPLLTPRDIKNQFATIPGLGNNLQNEAIGSSNASGSTTSFIA